MKKDIAVDLFKAIDSLLNQPQNAYPRGARDDEIVVEKDIVYSADLCEVCVLDAYFPPPTVLPDGALSAEGRPPLSPVLLYIHGGGFVAGGKEYREGISKWYASHGITVVNVNYGLCPDYLYPEPLLHLLTALDWVKDHCPELGADPNMILVSGDSAGAYYAAMLAAAATNRRFAKLLGKKPHAKIAGAIFDCGLYDIELTINTKFLFNVDEKIFAHFTGLSEKNFDTFAYRELCSPVNFVTPKFPPTFVQYAEKDLFCKGQGERLICKLKEQGVSFRAYGSRSLLANHCFPLNWKDGNAKKANAALLTFLDELKAGTLSREDGMAIACADAATDTPSQIEKKAPIKKLTAAAGKEKAIKE